jgi:Flp pilus assembly protein TadG
VKIRTRLLRDTAGSAAIEFAVAVPVLILMIWGMFQAAIVLEANAGVQQALGEGARYATIFDTTTNARPTDAQIAAKITNSKFGIRGTWEAPEIDTANEATDGYIDISVDYDVDTNFLFFDGPVITLSHSKRVYVQSL